LVGKTQWPSPNDGRAAIRSHEEQAALTREPFQFRFGVEIDVIAEEENM
jgi:hypothetical protein